MGRLAGKVAVVTGAGRGQGREVAERFAREGARVLALDASAEGLSELDQVAGVGAAGVGGACRTHRCDVSDEAQVAAAVARAEAELGPVSVLYNNAAINLGGRGDGATHEVDLDVLQRVLAVNAVGSFLVAKHALASMLAAGGGGAIVNVSSMGGLLSSESHAYSLSKGAVIAWTRSLANRYARDGIRANVIAPGVIDTPLARSVIGTSEVPASYTARIPLGRWGRCDEVADLAVFLASDESSYLTGAVIPIDGGISTGS